jgi:hypothetical protein
MASDSTLRDTMNQGEAGRLADVDRALKTGDILNALLAAMTATEAGVTVTTNVATLAAVPSGFWDAKATTATTTGSKKIRRCSAAFLTANNPPAGECLWDGALKVKFASADVVTVAGFKYSVTTDASVSAMKHGLDEQDATS